MNGRKSGGEFITKLGTAPGPNASFSLLWWQPDTLMEPLKSQLEDLNYGPKNQSTGKFQWHRI